MVHIITMIITNLLRLLVNLKLLKTTYIQT